MTPKKQVDPGAAAATTGTEEGFATRWSKRKHAARVAADAEAPPADNPIADASASAPAPPLTDQDMPPVESLTGDSDVSGFFSPGVSEELRHLALRKLFHTPEFNTRCPLDSEWYDCTKLTDLGSIITHEMRDELEREAQRLADAALDKALGGEQQGSIPAGPSPEPAAADPSGREGDVIAKNESNVPPEGRQSQPKDGGKQ